MARLHVPNTRRHKFVGDITTIWLCPADQFDSRMETSCGANEALGPNVWPRWLVWRAFGKMLHYYPTWVASSPLLFSGQMSIFL